MSLRTAPALERSARCFDALAEETAIMYFSSDSGDH